MRYFEGNVFQRAKYFSLSLESWIFLLHIESVNDLIINIIFSILFSMIILPHYLISLSCVYLMFLYLSLIRKRWCTRNGCRSWMTRWMLSSPI